MTHRDDSLSTERVNEVNNVESCAGDIDIMRSISLWPDLVYHLPNEIDPILQKYASEQMLSGIKTFIRVPSLVSDTASKSCKEAHCPFGQMWNHTSSAVSDTTSKANPSSRNFLATMDDIAGFSSRKRAFQNKSNRRKMMDRLDIPGWKQVADGNLEFFTNWADNEILDSKAFDVNILGPFGDCILHWALLQKQEDIAIWLMRKFPYLVYLEYTEEPFVGEGTMHIAVANGLTKAVRCILKICDQYESYRLESLTAGEWKDEISENPSFDNEASSGSEDCWKYPLNDQVVNGTFFKNDHEDARIYYGQHNIAFAVCRGNEEMVELMVLHDARLDILDEHKNSIIHLCVLFNQVRMFDKLCSLAKEQEKKTEGECFKYFGVDNETEKCSPTWQKWIQKHRNKERYTALQAAVAWDKLEMFEHLLNYQREEGWTWGPLAMFQYPLTEIDTHGIDNPNSVLEVIVSEGRRRFLDVTLIEDIFTEKWEQYGRYMFWAELFLYVIWILLLICSTNSIDFRAYDMGNHDSTLSLTGWNKYLLSLTVLFSVAFLSIEVYEIKVLWEEHGTKAGLRIYLSLKSIKHRTKANIGSVRRRFTVISISGIFKLIVWLRHCVTLVAAVGVMVYTERSLHIALVFNLVAIILAFVGILEFFQLQKNFGKFVIMVLKVLIRDVSVFTCVWIVILLGFAFCFTILRGDKNFSQALFFIMETSLSFGEFANESDAIYDTTLYNTIARYLYVVFILFSVVLLLNLLVAVMAETTQSIGQRDINRLNFQEQWASTILKMERRVPAFFYKRSGSPKKREEIQTSKSCWKYLFNNDAKLLNTDITYYKQCIQKSPDTCDEHYSEETKISIPKEENLSYSKDLIIKVS